MRFLAERGQGFPTSAGPVPIVVAAALFDLPVARAPGPEEGWAAAVDAARGEPAVSGRIGAGRGATVGKWRGREYAVPGGLGTAAVREGDATVGALVACNAGRRRHRRRRRRSWPARRPGRGAVVPGADALRAHDPGGGGHRRPGRKAECHLVAQSAHDGLARAIRPAHTRYDGDFAAVLATGEVDAHPDRLREAAAEAVAAAVRAAVARRSP